MKKILTGLLIFFSGLAFFLLYFDEEPDFIGLRVDKGLEEGNYSGTRFVNKKLRAKTEGDARAGSPSSGEGREITLTDLSVHEVGDEIDMFIPQENRSYRGEVTKVDITAAGNRVLTGFFEADKQRHRFIFTTGQYQTFGTLQTAIGRYQLEARNGLGRLISTAEINQKLDFSSPDYLIPERVDPIPEEVVGGRTR